MHTNYNSYAHKKISWILSIYYQDIEQKWNLDINQGLQIFEKWQVTIPT